MGAHTIRLKENGLICSRSISELRNVAMEYFRPITLTQECNSPRLHHILKEYYFMGLRWLNILIIIILVIMIEWGFLYLFAKYVQMVAGQL